MTVSFRQALRTTHLGEGLASAELTEDWGQGRASFGGLLAALALAPLPMPAGRSLRSLVATFPAPLGPGPVQIHHRLLRAGRNLSLISAEVRRGDAVGVSVHAAFGTARSTALSLAPPRASAQPEGTQIFPYLPGVTPVFTQHFDCHWRSALPFTGAPVPGIDGWVRHHDPAPVDALGVIALVDAWPAPVLPMLSRPAPASTVSWMLNLVRPVPDHAADAWWRFQAEASCASEGYADISGELFAPDGLLIATSRQLVAEFSKP